MFNPQTCKRCGACLMLCPFLEMSKAQAATEIARLIETKSSDNVLTKCAGCSYCDIICPTQSNPSDLRKEILHRKNRQIGVGDLRIMSEQVPFNIMKAGLATDSEKKTDRLRRMTNPGRSEEVFYLGCSLSYIHTDLIETRLLDELPMIGGMQYCCGAYAYHLFGADEAKHSGTELLQKLKADGVKRVVTFCPECDYMLGKVYPALIEDFDMQTVTIIDYLLERHQNGRLPFVRKINKNVTFHDACAWRKLDGDIYEGPRRLLDAMGAKVFEMAHHRRKSMCCGTPLTGKDSRLAAAVAEKRVFEAKASGAEAIVVNCTGCFSMLKKAAQYGLEIFHILELVQLAVGESPPHRIGEVQNRLIRNIMARIDDDPDLLKRRSIIEKGRITPLG